MLCAWWPGPSKAFVQGKEWSDTFWCNCLLCHEQQQSFALVELLLKACQPSQSDCWCLFWLLADARSVHCNSVWTLVHTPFFPSNGYRKATHLPALESEMLMHIPLFGGRVDDVPKDLCHWLPVPFYSQVISLAPWLVGHLLALEMPWPPVSIAWWAVLLQCNSGCHCAGPSVRLKGLILL